MTASAGVEGETRPMVTDEPPPTGAALDSQQRSRLAEIMAATTQSLRAGFAELKASFSHDTSKGAGGEALVAQFLQKRLPGQVGATAGQVIDSTGQMSRQVDVVLYDRARTPMLFTSPNGHDQLIPVEGVLAVVEVKTHLTKAMLPAILENCRSVKLLKRTAYFPRSLNSTYRIYDQDWIDFPIYYSVFAAKADNMYAGELNELQYDSPLHERIDSVCYLDRGTNLNVSLPDVHGAPQVSATASSGSGLMDIESEQALLHWYGGLAGMIAQAELRSINILAYMAREMRVSGTMPNGKVTEDSRRGFSKRCPPLPG